MYAPDILRPTSDAPSDISDRSLISDELRYATHPARSRACKTTGTGAVAKRFQRYGFKVVQFSEEFCANRGYILGDGVLYRGGNGDRVYSHEGIMDES